MSYADLARRWAETRTSDLDAHAELYAADELFVIESRKVDDHLADTISDRADLRRQLAFWTNEDAGNGQGVHSLTLRETLEGNGHLLLHWDYAVEGLDAFHGLPVEGRVLTSKGSTFLQLDGDGKIVLESTFLNETPLYQQVGVPLVTPHYWVEGFDPAALAA